MTSYQQGQAAFAAGIDRFSNPYAMGSVDWSSWRNGHNAAQSADVFARQARRGTRQIGQNNLNLGSR